MQKSRLDAKLSRHVTRRSVIGGIGAAALSATSLVSCSSLEARSGNDSRPLRSFKSEQGRARFTTAYDALMRLWPIPYESLRVSTRFGETHVIASGPESAPALILLPALMTTAGVWRPNVAALSERYRTYAVDTLGEPNRSEAVRAQHDRRDCADWMLDLMDGLRVDRASLIGSSLGGFRALNQALMAPERVDRVVLISPAAFPLTWKFYWYASLGIFGSSRLDAWMGNGIAFNPVNQPWADVYTAAMADGRLVNDISLGSIDEKELATLTRPTLLLIGDKEVIYERKPEDVLVRARARTSNLVGEIVPDANHLAAMANPEYVNKRILEFLRS